VVVEDVDQVAEHEQRVTSLARRLEMPRRSVQVGDDVDAHVDA
jgi:hypothetical protein